MRECDYPKASGFYLCQLDDGTIVPYDVCDESANGYDDPVWEGQYELIGRGYILVAGGVTQSHGDHLYFFKRRAQ